MTAYTKHDGPLAADTAREALAAAVANGFTEEEVLVVDNYFLVPDEDGDRDKNGHQFEHVVESIPAVEATLNAWGEDNSALEGKANIENVENDSQPADEFDIDTAKVPELNQFIVDNGLDVDEGLNKSDKVAAIKAALENKE